LHDRFVIERNLGAANRVIEALVFGESIRGKRR
jgi:hypothetical protein